jgi:hypothetical protein
MASSTPERFIGSAAFALITQQQWQWRMVSEHEVELERCPFCHKDGYNKFYMQCYGIDADPVLRGGDGLYKCHRCNKAGNLKQLRRELGLDLDVESKKEQAGFGRTPDALPDVDSCHAALMSDEDALLYLMEERGWSYEIIERQKIGLTLHYFRDTGTVRALVFPFIYNGNCLWAHYRTLPSMQPGAPLVQKAFSSPAGYDAVLYNGQILLPGIRELVLVEGEADCITALDHGIVDVCGVPGANIKKADWINTIDRLEIEKVYICYDSDNVGQKAAQTIASRIGIQRCYKLCLPAFTLENPDGSTRPGKDINEWFRHGGGSLDAFNALRRDARLFDVDGVASAQSAIDEFLDELKGHGVAPKYKSPWHSLNRLVGFNEGDVIDILAPEKIGKTTFGINFMEHMVQNYGDDGIIICLEMTRASIAKKYISMKGNVADYIPETPEQAEELTAAYLAAIPVVQAELLQRPGDLLFSYPKYKSVEEIYNLIKDCIRRYGVKWIMLDNLQRLCDTTLGSKNRTQHLSEISKVTSQIAKDFRIQMVRILQPHRIGENKIVTTDSVDGSSQIAKDCDHMLTLWRKRIPAAEDTDSVGSFESRMAVNVGLSRYSQGGQTHLFYDGARSLVRELRDNDPGYYESIHGKSRTNTNPYANAKPWLEVSDIRP